ncbi:MAG: hypothetical protein ABSA48_10470 [Terracidiphilus sp.]|jgi:hypothetical protein
MKAIDSLLAGLIDYAGLYPPAGLDMHSALRNYCCYARSKHAPALGRFLVDMNRLPELREAAGDSMRGLRLSVIALPETVSENLQRFLDDGFPIEAVEIKTDWPSAIERIGKRIPAGLTAYFEVPIVFRNSDLFAAISAAGARIKLRMGGLAAEAFPSTQVTANMLKAIADRRIPFKATAGLHHPVRSRHPLTNETDGPAGTMHGFINLACAAALLHFGGEASDAKLALNEEDPGAWQVTPAVIGWRSSRWTAEQLRTVRQQFFISFGSCSFEEPVHDLEVLGWL